MGKFIFTFGNSGIWESSRPIIFPFFLGLLNQTFNSIYILRLFELGLTLIYGYIVYLIGKEILDEEVGIISVLILLTIPTIFNFSGMLLSEIMSSVFILLAVYLLFKKRFFWSGIFGGIGFLTRFLELIVFSGVFLSFIILIFIFYKNKKFHDLLKGFFRVVFGFICPVVVYFVINDLIYGDFLKPIKDQIFLTAETGWMYSESIVFYVVTLINEAPLLLLFPIGIFLFWKYYRGKLLKYSLVLCLVIPLLFFHLINHKEMRFFLVIFPFMVLFVSYGIVMVYRFFKNKELKLLNLLLILVFVVSIVVSFGNIVQFELGKNYNFENEEIFPYNEFMDNSKVGDIWISNPKYSLYSGNKVSKLIYYPTFNDEYSFELIEGVNMADYVLINSCDIPCNPNFNNCVNRKFELLSGIRNNFNLVYDEMHKNCVKLIGERKE
tara:strand:- start:650 stop:1960 length:1311 start_codon:yes stop_codon:yes gene_type:complete